MRSLARRFGRVNHFRGKSRLENLLEKVALPLHGGAPEWVELTPHGFALELDWKNKLDRSLFLRDGEPDTVWAISQLLRDVSVFWDAGANIGFYSLLASSVSGVNKVFSFEPSPRNFPRLERNIAWNHADKITPLQIALLDREGSADMFEVGGDNHGMDSLFASSGHQASAEVLTCTVDQLIKGGLPAPDLVKMDCEGSELKILRGARMTLAENAPVLILELSSWTARSAGYEPGDIRDELASFGYEMLWPHRKRWTRVAGSKLPHIDVLGDGHGSNYVFLPPGFRRL